MRWRKCLLLASALCALVLSWSCESETPSGPDLGEIPDPSAGSGLYVVDPLTNRRSVGEVGGGEFRSDGWKAANARSSIRYEIPATANGLVEFQVANLRNPNPPFRRASGTAGSAPT